MHAPHARIIEQEPFATADASADGTGPDGTGWFCMHRKVIKSAVFAVPELLKCFVWCLARANPTTAKVPVKTGRGTTFVELKAGEFITGRESAGEALGMPGTTAMDRLRRLEALDVIKLRSVTHFSIVSVVNWQAYQNASTKTRHPSVTQVTPNRHPSVTDNNKTIKQDSPNGESISPTAADAFDRFWKAFPSRRKTAKAKAREAWRSNGKGDAGSHHRRGRRVRRKPDRQGAFCEGSGTLAEWRVLGRRQNRMAMERQR